MEQNNKYCIDSKTVNLQAVLQLKYRKILYVLIKLGPCIILLNVSDSEPENLYKLYAYNKCVYSNKGCLYSLGNTGHYYQ